MEDSLIAFVIIFSVSVIPISVIYLTKFNGIGRKKAIKSIERQNIDEIIKSYQNSMEVLKSQNQFLFEDSKQVKQKLSREMGINMRKNEVELEASNPKINSKNLRDYYEIDLSNGLKLVESMNLPFLKDMDKSKIPELINNPIIKNKVWSYIKDNKDEMIDLGVIVPIGQKIQDDTVVEKTKVKEETDGNMMNLSFGNENGKYMA